MRDTRLIYTVTALAVAMLASAATPAFADPGGDSSSDGAQVSHACFEAADLCQHQVLTSSGNNNGYSFFTPDEPVGSPPNSAEVVQRCEEEPGTSPERVCVHSTRTPSGNILSSFHAKPAE